MLTKHDHGLRHEMMKPRRNPILDDDSRKKTTGKFYIKASQNFESKQIYRGSQQLYLDASLISTFTVGWVRYTSTVLFYIQEQTTYNFAL